MSRESSNASAAILTGDLIGSRDLSADAVAAARQSLAGSAATLQEWGCPILGGPDVFRGDAWQLAIGDAAWWLRATVLIRARLIGLGEGVDTRVGIGVGAVERIEANVSQSLGSAFIYSGEALDTMPSRTTFAFAAGDAPTWVNPVLSLCGVVIDRWKPKQALAAAQALAPGSKTQADVADALGLKRQTVNGHLVSSGFHAVLQAVELVEGCDWQFGSIEQKQGNSPALTKAG